MNKTRHDFKNKLEVLGISLFIFNFIDWWSTVTLMNRPGFVELNPIARYFLQNNMSAVLLLLKFAVVYFGTKYFIHIMNIDFFYNQKKWKLASYWTLVVANIMFIWASVNNIWLVIGS